MSDWSIKGREGIRLMFTEVHKMTDMNPETIKELLFKQARAYSVKREQSFDFQFSDRWVA